MPRYPIVLMDADDTLFDFGASENIALFETLEHFGEEKSQENLLLYKKINRRYWDLFELGQIEKPQLLVRRFEDFFASLGLFPDCREANSYYLDRLSRSSILFPQAEELCRRLSERSRIYIVTNGTKTAQLGRIGSSPVAKYISDMFISEELGVQKPNAEFFKEVFRRIGSPPREQAIIFGDSLTSDMRGGRNAGIATCLFDPSGTRKNGDCDYSVTSLLDFLSIVE